MGESGEGDLVPLRRRIGERQHPQAPKVGEKQESSTSQSGGQGARKQGELTRRVEEGVVSALAKEVLTNMNDSYIADKVFPRIQRAAEGLGMTTEKLLERIRERVKRG